jgi:hypothetical protein
MAPYNPIPARSNHLQRERVVFRVEPHHHIQRDDAVGELGVAPDSREWPRHQPHPDVSRDQGLAASLREQDITAGAEQIRGIFKDTSWNEELIAPVSQAEAQRLGEYLVQSPRLRPIQTFSTSSAASAARLLPRRLTGRPRWFISATTNSVL